MGNILTTHRNVIMAILANYCIGEEIDLTADKLVALGIAIRDLHELRDIFSRDVCRTCTRLMLFDIGTYDIYWYEFTHEDIANEVSITNQLAMKIFMYPWFLFCKNTDEYQWITLQDKLKYVLSQNNKDITRSDSSQ